MQEVVLPDFGFFLPDEREEGFDVAAYFLDCVHDWVMDTHPDDVRERLVVLSV